MGLVWVILWVAVLVLMPAICVRLHRENEVTKRQLQEELAACFSRQIFMNDEDPSEEGSVNI